MKRDISVEELWERFRRGDRRALARVLTLVENEHRDGAVLLGRIIQRTGGARIMGITGPPGAGKSTLVDKIALAFHEMGRSVGILAVDPSSPFSGGAILGDRIRMGTLNTLEGVFIRSVSTRGALGGLSRATESLVHVMDAFGKDVVIVETVGVGQSEVDIVRIADTAVVVEVPGLGDGIQMIKAGIVEIADVFVVNKADREGADRTRAEIEMMLDGVVNRDGWTPPVVSTVATDGSGIDELIEAVEEHWKHLRRHDLLDERTRGRRRYSFRRILEGELNAMFIETLDEDGVFSRVEERVCAGQLDPYEGAAELLELFRERMGDSSPRTRGTAPGTPPR